MFSIFSQIFIFIVIRSYQHAVWGCLVSLECVVAAGELLCVCVLSSSVLMSIWSSSSHHDEPLALCFQLLCNYSKHCWSAVFRLPTTSSLFFPHVNF